MIRPLKISDYQNVIDFISEYGFPTLTLDEMFDGQGFVWDDDGLVVGFMHAWICGHVAIIDYLLVDQKCRYKAENGRSVIGMSLAAAMFKLMVNKGVTKFIGIMNQRDGCETMLSFYQEIGMTERKPYAIVKGDPQVCWTNLQEKLEAQDG